MKSVAPGALLLAEEVVAAAVLARDVLGDGAQRFVDLAFVLESLLEHGDREHFPSVLTRDHSARDLNNMKKIGSSHFEQVCVQVAPAKCRQRLGDGRLEQRDVANSTIAAVRLNQA